MVIRSPLTAPAPTEPMHVTLLNRFEEIDQMFPDKVAMRSSVNHADCVTYRQVRDYSLRFAAYLTTKGVQKGERVVIVLPNCWEYVVSILGTWTAGLVSSATSPSFTVYELAHQLKDTEPVVIVTEDTVLDKIKTASKGLTGLKEIICVQTSNKILDCTPFSTTLATSSLPRPDMVKIDLAEDICTIPYSSGTSGMPKGVMLSHMNMAAMAIILINRGPKTLDHETTLCALPTYHQLGLFNTLMSLKRAKHLVMFRRFNLEQFLQHVQKYKVENLVLVPAIAQMLAESPLLEKYDLSCVKTMSAGGAVLPKSTQRRLEKLLPLSLRSGYGMTELTVAMCMINSLDEPMDSVGGLIANAELKVVDPKTGRECAANQSGELRFRGSNVMKGYWKNPKATKETFDEDGFLKTGDLGYYDDKGLVFITGRIKELIKVKGLQVSPSELENLLLALNGVKDCGVIGVPDKKAGELPAAFIVRGSQDLTEDDVHRFVNERVAPYKRLTGGVFFVDSLPRTPTGKLQRHKIKLPESTKEKSKL